MKPPSHPSSSSRSHRYKWLALVLASGPGLAAAEAGPVVAVFNIEQSRVKLPDDAIAALSDYLATMLAEKGRYQIVPRDELKKRLAGQKEASYQACYAESCQIELGKELAAQKSLAPRLMKLGSSCKLSLTLFDLATGTSERAATEAGGCTEDDIVGTLERAVGKLLGAPAAGAVTTSGGAPSAPAETVLARQADPPTPRPELPAEPRATGPAPAGPPPSPQVPAKEPAGNPATSAKPAATQTTPQPATPTAATPSPAALPERPSRMEVAVAMRKLVGPLRQCGARVKVKKSVKAKVTFAPSGEVSEAGVDGVPGDSPAAACVVAALKQARVGPSEKGLTVRYPLVLH